MSDFDRKLVDLISSLTDEGEVNNLGLFVHHSGPSRCSRVIQDNFAVVRRVPFDERFHETMQQVLREESFMPTDEALRQVEEPQISVDYFLSAGPWAPICLENEPNLIFRYAAYDPEAVAEVRARNRKRREEWVRTRESS